MATNAIRAASALGTINGIMDGVNQAFKEFNDGNIKLGDFLTRLVSSASSAVYAFNTLTTAVQAFGVAEKTRNTRIFAEHLVIHQEFRCIPCPRNSAVE